MDTITLFLAEARRMVRALTPQILAAWNAPNKTPQKKRDGSLVTETDQRVERELLQAFRHTLPQLPVIAEEQIGEALERGEQGSARRYQETLQHEHCIVIDPIDGTKNFVEGKPIFCIALGLTRRVGEGQWPVAGVVGVPVEDCMYWSDGQQVVWESLSSDDQVRVTRAAGGASTIFANSTEARWMNERAIVLRGERVSSGASVYDILATCLGHNRAALLGSQRFWDIAAPVALAAPLGLKVCDATTGQEVASLTANSFSADREKRLWRLERRMLLLPRELNISEFLAQA